MVLGVSIDGYWQVHLAKDGGHTTFRVHRLMAAAFIPNPSGHAEVNHKNLIKSDNALSNLEWTSRRGNAAHASANGAWAPGVMAKKLTVDDVRSIKDMRASGVGRQQVADLHGVTYQMIRAIDLGTCWRYVSPTHRAILRP